MSVIVRKIKSAVRYGRQHGIGALVVNILTRFRSGNPVEAIASLVHFRKNDVLKLYSFVRLAPARKDYDGCVDEKSINWFVPYFGRGSGGHLNIFRFIFHLERLGYDCRIIIIDPPANKTEEEVKCEIDDWFFPLKSRVLFGPHDAEPSFFSMATAWQTAYLVRAFEKTRHRCYFVQDFEPSFYSVGSEYLFAEATYKFGFTGITAGDWLKNKLASEYGMRTYSVGFSYDHGLYKPHERREPEIKRVFFYARPPTLRRAFELGLLALDEVVQRMPHVKVIFAGWDLSNYEIPFEHLNAGVLTTDELPDLYSQCDVALVLSFTNLSLLPLELMACGTPVVSNKGASAEWLLNERNSMLADSTVESLADAICKVLSDSELAEFLRNGGFDTVRDTDWVAEAKKMGAILSEVGRH